MNWTSNGEPLIETIRFQEIGNGLYDFYITVKQGKSFIDLLYHGIKIELVSFLSHPQEWAAEDLITNLQINLKAKECIILEVRKFED